MGKLHPRAPKMHCPATCPAYVLWLPGTEVTLSLGAGGALCVWKGALRRHKVGGSQHRRDQNSQWLRTRCKC